MLLSRLELEVSDVGDWDLPFIGCFVCYLCVVHSAYYACKFVILSLMLCIACICIPLLYKLFSFCINFCSTCKCILFFCNSAMVTRCNIRCLSEWTNDWICYESRHGEVLTRIDSPRLHSTSLCKRFVRAKLGDKLYSSKLASTDRSSYICAYWLKTDSGLMIPQVHAIQDVLFKAQCPSAM